MTEAEQALIDQLTPTDIVALTLFGEIRGGDINAVIAVGSVILNRSRQSGESVDAVCLHPAQFSCWSSDPYTRNDEAVMAAARTLASHLPLGNGAMRKCVYVAEAVASGKLNDTVKGATHYYAPKSMRPIGKVPSWAIGLTPVAKIGGQFFFTGVKWYGSKQVATGKSESHAAPDGGIGNRADSPDGMSADQK